MRNAIQGNDLNLDSLLWIADEISLLYTVVSISILLAADKSGYFVMCRARSHSYRGYLWCGERGRIARTGRRTENNGSIWKLEKIVEEGENTKMSKVFKKYLKERILPKAKKSLS